MKQLDLHGKTLLETEAIFEGFLNEARLKGKLIEVCFVTGIGALRQRLQEMAIREDLHWYVPFFNPGRIMVEFE